MSDSVSVPTLAFPLDEWCDDDGDVLWWRFPIVEPPYVGSPLYADWDEDLYTHWTRIVVPQEPPRGATDDRWPAPPQELRESPDEDPTCQGAAVGVPMVCETCGGALHEVLMAGVRIRWEHTHGGRQHLPAPVLASTFRPGPPRPPTPPDNQEIRKP